MKYIFVFVQFILIVMGLAVLKEKTQHDSIERFVRSVIYIVIYNIAVAMVLAICGWYSLAALSLADVCLGVFLFLSLLRKKQFLKNAWICRQDIWTHKYILLGLIVCACLYLGFPTTYMLGGRDPGLYYLNGIHIAETGAYQYEEDLYLSEHQEELEGILTPGYPGLYSDYEYGYSEKWGDITPQFMPMYASAMAIGYDVGGVSLMIRVNGLISLLSLLMVYFFVRRMVSEKAALLSVGLLAVSPAQLWYGRNSVSEILLQLLIFISVDFFARGYETKNKHYSIAAGILLGLGVMDRIDAYILGAGLFAFCLYIMIWEKEHRRYIGYAVFSYTVMGSLAFLYGRIFLTEYFYDHMKNMGSLTKILLLDVALLVLCVVVWAISRKKRSICSKNMIARLFDSKMAVIVLGIMLGAVWIYAYVFRSLGYSADAPDYFIKHNIVELSWYVSPMIMVLAIIGMVGSLYKNFKHYEPYLLFFIIGLSNYIGYGINPYISKDHIWAARRWVTIIIPFLVITGVMGIRFLHQRFSGRYIKLGRAITICISVVCGIFMLYQSKAFLFVRIMDNLDVQVETLANEMEDDVLYVTTNAWVASYLRYVYGKQVYIMNSGAQAAIDAYIDEMKELYYIGDYGQIEGLMCDKELIMSYNTKGLFLEQLIGEYPRELYERTYDASIYRLYE